MNIRYTAVSHTGLCAWRTLPQLLESSRMLSHNGEALAYRSDPPGSGIQVSPKARWCPLRDSQVWRWLTHAFQGHNTPNPRKYTRGWYCSCQSVCIIKGFTSRLKRVWHRS
ncbi:hypothetical protein ARMGADRAFT_230631 [Armillaria gallica]|uniref:Uncharacterized protein n=1 Tax=Armillaria gallica TaxID=47427 RepID=A0A2H3E332_ARMGA|nr:hypothetical protein ARMGADRAFT_230631 [Armillaria gallica]